MAEIAEAGNSVEVLLHVLGRIGSVQAVDKACGVESLSAFSQYAFPNFRGQSDVIFKSYVVTLEHSPLTVVLDSCHHDMPQGDHVGIANIEIEDGESDDLHSVAYKRVGGAMHVYDSNANAPMPSIDNYKGRVVQYSGAAVLVLESPEPRGEVRDQQAARPRAATNHAATNHADLGVWADLDGDVRDAVDVVRQVRETTDGRNGTFLDELLDVAAPMVDDSVAAGGGTASSRSWLPAMLLLATTVVASVFG